MTLAIDRFVAAWIDGALGAAVVSGVAALAMVGCRQPARRCVLARLAILGVLAVPPLRAWGALPRLPIAVPVAALAPPRPSLGTGPPPRSGFLGPCARGAALGGAVGSALGLAMVGLGALGGLRLVRKTVEPAAETLEVYAALPFRSPWRRPKLRVSARVRAPVLVGVLRPTILVPPELDEPGEATALRLGLLHELAHAERLDSLCGLLSSVAGALWFFLPPLWWLRAQMKLDQEFLADLRASGGFDRRASYASSLVGLAQAGDAGPEAPMALGGAALTLRVLMLVKCPYPVEVRAPGRWRMGVAAAMTGLTLAASGLSLRGMAARPWGGPVAPRDAAGPRHGVLQISRLKIPPAKPGPDGRVPPYRLFQPLPERFEMVLDVWADAPDLPKIAVAGRFLGPRSVAPPGLAEGPRPHRVRLVRDHRGIALWVDGREVPPRPDDLPPPALVAFRPAPGKVGDFRDLTLTW